MQSIIFSSLAGLFMSAQSITIDLNKLPVTPKHYEPEVVLSASDVGQRKQYVHQFEDGFHDLNLNIVVREVHRDHEWDAYSQLIFTSKSSPRSVVFYLYYNQLNQIEGLIDVLPVKDHKPAPESLDAFFEVGQALTVLMVTSNEDKADSQNKTLELGIGFERKAFIDKMFTIAEEDEHVHDESFDFQFIKMGFRPDTLTYVSVGMEVEIQDIQLNPVYNRKKAPQAINAHLATKKNAPN